MVRTQGGYFFMYLISSVKAITKTIINIISVLSIHSPPLKGAETAATVSLRFQRISITFIPVNNLTINFTYELYLQHLKYSVPVQHLRF